MLLTDDCKNILVDHAGYVYEGMSSSHYDETAEHLEMSSQSKNNPHTYVNFENDNYTFTCLLVLLLLLKAISIPFTTSIVEMRH